MNNDKDKVGLRERLMGSWATPLLAAVLIGGTGMAIGLAGVASAQVTTSATTTQSASGGGHRMGPGVMGTVASVSGDTITVTGKNGTTYTVDATNATFHKSTSGSAPSTVTIADIAVGDTVGIRGTVSGTTVTATDVMDGIGGPGGDRGGPGRGPGVNGTVTAVSGNTVTITNSDGTTYTIDASNAKISKIEDLTVSDIQVGDKIGVQGMVSGTSVSAKNIMDGLPPMPNASSTSSQ